MVADDIGKAHVYETRTRRKVATVAGDARGVQVALDDNGGQLAVLDQQGVLHVWNLASQSPTARRDLGGRFGDAAFRRLEFDKSGDFLLACGKHGLFRIGPLSASGLIRKASLAVPCNLSPAEWSHHIGEDTPFQPTIATAPLYGEVQVENR